MAKCTCRDGDGRVVLSRCSSACACLGTVGNLYEPQKWRPSAEIRIDRFRQILMLPLAFHRDAFAETDDVRPLVERLLESLAVAKDDWEPVQDLSRHCDDMAPEHFAAMFTQAEFGERDVAAKRKATGDGTAELTEAERDAADRRHAETETKRRATVESTMAYAEQVYFHDFLRETMFSAEPSGSDKEINLFRRKGRHRISFQLDRGGRTFRAKADLDRINLYVFSSGAAVLVVEADFRAPDRFAAKLPCSSCDARPDDAAFQPAPMTLADALMICDHFRRVYPPFFFVHREKQCGDAPAEPAFAVTAQRVPHDVEISRQTDSGSWQPVDLPTGWSNEDVGDFATADHALRHRRKSAPPVADHVRILAAPLRIAGTPEAENLPADVPLMRQVVDERMPLMTFLTVEEGSDPQDAMQGTVSDDETRSVDAASLRAQDALRAISRGDWMRLCYADEPGTDVLPYAAPFMARFEEECCYDRFFPHPSSTDATSRIMTCGYHFVVAGAGSFANDTLQHHFRRHYFQMALACHMEIAAMLTTSSRVTQAVKRLNDAGDASHARRRFEATMQAIESDFLKYVHVFHFTGMSNQIQPGEMLKKWQDRLGTRTMFEDVKSEIDTANQFLVAVDQARSSDAAMRLNVIATTGVVLGLAFAFLSMNVLGAVPESPAAGDASLPLADPRHWRAFGVTLCLAATVGLALSLLIDRDWLKPHNSAAHRQAGLFFWSGAGVILFGLLAMSLGAAAGGWTAPPGPLAILVIGAIPVAAAGLSFGRPRNRAIAAAFAAALDGPGGATRILLAGLSLVGLGLAAGAATVAELFG